MGKLVYVARELSSAILLVIKQTANAILCRPRSTGLASLLPASEQWAVQRVREPIVLIALPECAGSQSVAKLSMEFLVGAVDVV